MLILTHLIWGCVLKFTSCLAPMNSIAWTFPPQSCALERDFWYLIIDCIKVKYLPPLLPTHSKTFWELDIVCVAPSTVQRLARCHINSILIISKHYHPGKWYSFLVSLSLSTANCLCASTVGRRNTRLWIMPHKQCDLIVQLLPLQIPVYFR